MAAHRSSELMGGKSELLRAGRSVTRSGDDPKESATERETAPWKRKNIFHRVRVKR